MEEINYSQDTTTYFNKSTKTRWIKINNKTNEIIYSTEAYRRETNPIENNDTTQEKPAGSTTEQADQLAKKQATTNTIITAKYEIWTDFNNFDDTIKNNPAHALTLLKEKYNDAIKDDRIQNNPNNVRGYTSSVIKTAEMKLKMLDSITDKNTGTPDFSLLETPLSKQLVDAQSNIKNIENNNTQKFDEKKQAIQKLKDNMNNESVQNPHTAQAYDNAISRLQVKKIETIINSPNTSLDYKIKNLKNRLKDQSSENQQLYKDAISKLEDQSNKLHDQVSRLIYEKNSETTGIVNDTTKSLNAKIAQLKSQLEKINNATVKDLFTTKQTPNANHIDYKLSLDSFKNGLHDSDNEEGAIDIINNAIEKLTTQLETEGEASISHAFSNLTSSNDPQKFMTLFRTLRTSFNSLFTGAPKTPESAKVAAEVNKELNNTQSASASSWSSSTFIAGARKRFTDLYNSAVEAVYRTTVVSSQI